LLSQDILMPALLWKIHGSKKGIVRIRGLRDASARDARFSIGIVAWLDRASIRLYLIALLFGRLYSVDV